MDSSVPAWHWWFWSQLFGQWTAWTLRTGAKSEYGGALGTEQPLPVGFFA